MWVFWTIQSILAEDFCKSESTAVIHSIQAIQQVLHTKDCQKTLQKLGKVESLVLIDQDISDISVLEVATELRYLNLRGNDLSSFDVANTAIEWLDLSYNPIVSISSDSAKTIYCNHCQLSRLDAIQTPKVKKLILRDNQITEIVLQDFSKLSVLLLSNNQVTDVSPLIGMNRIKILDISLNPISKEDCPTDKSIGKGLRTACGALYD